MIKSLLDKKAEEFAIKLGKSDFVATEGWLSRWKTRHQIKSRRTHGEKSSADFEGAEVWASTVLPQLLQDYNLKTYIMQMKLDCITELHQIVPYVIHMSSSVDPKRLWSVSLYYYAQTCLGTTN